MSEIPEPDVVPDPLTEEQIAEAAQHDHDDARIDEWEEESFPASDPPSNY